MDEKKNQASKQESETQTPEVEKIKIGEKEYTKEELEKELNKSKELESEYTKKYIELTNTQKELQPLIELQQYLAENPDKAEQITKILQDDGKKEESFETDIPEVKKLKAEIDELKKIVQESKANIEYEKQVKQNEIFFKTEIAKLAQKYPDLDEDILIARLMAVPNLGQIPKNELITFMDKLAEDIDSRVKEKKNKYIQEYLSKKEKDSDETLGEKKGGETGGKKEKIEGIKINDGSAKRTAIEYLNRLLKK